MKNPDLTDRVVPVTAYLTDETFGYDYWAARQFTAPNVPSRRYAVLIICDSEKERDIWVDSLRHDRMKSVFPPPSRAVKISWDDRGVRTVDGVPDDARADVKLADLIRQGPDE